MNCTQLLTEVAVVGSGAAGYAAALDLYALGVRDIILVTEGRLCGTSRNTGSDKQTYYKLTLAGGVPDSVRDMARTLFEGGARDGDTALTEAALSARCFYRLCELGVPFPHNELGEYVGYKTDHDPRSRASSAGPLTSRYMTEALEREFFRLGLRQLDGCFAAAILTDGERARGVLALQNGNPLVIACGSIVWATGGPAGMYDASVYPESQHGATGAALEAGVRCANLTESQFGIASVKFRWNLSGSYQQALPRYISTDRNGGDAREFLSGNFPDDAALLRAVFLKGYQWPFDPRKLENSGSSLVDLLVYRETDILKRRVFLDYRTDPAGYDPAALDGETRAYLENCGALCGLPVERLLRINAPAAELYRQNGIDLTREPLEIRVCNQHSNGGIAVDADFRTSLPGLYAVGECAGNFGVYRPGGSALNATQAGALRAAQHIARTGAKPCSVPRSLFCGALERFERLSAGNGAEAAALAVSARKRMSLHGGFVRSAFGIREALSAVRSDFRLLEGGGVRAASLTDALRLRDMMLCQIAWLSAMEEYDRMGGVSRGSYLILDEAGTSAGGFTYRNGVDILSSDICETTLCAQSLDCSHRWRGVRPLPDPDCWFESVWARFEAGRRDTAR